MHPAYTATHRGTACIDRGAGRRQRPTRHRRHHRPRLLWQSSRPHIRAPAATEPPAPAGPKVLKVRITADIQDMDPAFMTGSLENSITNNVYQGLIEYRGNYDKYYDALISEPLTVSEDGLKISFKLQEGIQFQKGYGELTAEDVKYSFERIINPDLDASYRDNWKTLDHVEVTGKYTGDIILKEPFAPLFSSTLPATTGWIVSKKAVEELGDEQAEDQPDRHGPVRVRRVGAEPESGA